MKHERQQEIRAQVIADLAHVMRYERERARVRAGLLAPSDDENDDAERRWHALLLDDEDE